jgi:hypothetical protein
MAASSTDSGTVPGAGMTSYLWLRIHTAACRVNRAGSSPMKSWSYSHIADDCRLFDGRSLPAIVPTAWEQIGSSAPFPTALNGAQRR